MGKYGIFKVTVSELWRDKDGNDISWSDLSSYYVRETDAELAVQRLKDHLVGLSRVYREARKTTDCKVAEVRLRELLFICQIDVD